MDVTLACGDVQMKAHKVIMEERQAVAAKLEENNTADKSKEEAGEAILCRRNVY